MGIWIGYPINLLKKRLIWGIWTYLFETMPEKCSYVIWNTSMQILTDMQCINLWCIVQIVLYNTIKLYDGAS